MEYEISIYWFEDEVKLFGIYFIIILMFLSSCNKKKSNVPRGVDGHGAEVNAPVGVDQNVTLPKLL